MSSNHKQENIFTKFEIVKKSTNNQSLEESSNSHQNSQDKKEEHNQIEQCSKTPSSSSSSSSSSEEEKLKKKDEEEEDGFRTPTSLDHKISVLTCPPPPKKIKVQSLKRKTASYNNQYYSCRQLPLDLSKEVELLFSPTHHIQLSDHSHRAKKIRRGDKEQK